jgi:ABC-type multidrug transport system fused ATPase/permease subunit
MLKTIIDAFKLMWLGTGNSLSLKIRLWLNFACGLVTGIALYLSTFYLSELVKSVSNSDLSSVKYFLILLLSTSMVVVIVRFIYRYFTEFIGKNIVNNIRKYYFIKVVHENYSWHLHNSVGYFAAMLNKVTGLINNWVWQMCYDFLPKMIFTLLFFVYAYSVSVWLFIYFVVCTIILIFGIRISYIRRARLIKEASICDRALEKTFTDLLYNIRTIKKMNLLKFANRKINEKSTDAENKNREVMVYNAYQWGFMEFFVQAQFFAPLIYFAYQLTQTGQGIEILVMLAAVQSHMIEIGRQIMHFIQPVISAQQEFALLAEHIGDTDVEENNSSFNENWKKIIFKNTYFDFKKDGNKFIHSVPNFVINRGDHIAVMGESGAGKSTFFNLLTRQYKPKKGKILLDDMDYNLVSQNFFDKEFTYVSQDIELFDMTFYENIVMGKKISAEQFQEIIDGCCLNELLARMGGNPHTDIGEKGVKVSGGEKQRINLARGLLLNRDILVLDEITANLDPITTKKIWQFVFKQYTNKTIIAISHEPELVSHVNKKLIFKKGIGK